MVCIVMCFYWIIADFIARRRVRALHIDVYYEARFVYVHTYVHSTFRYDTAAVEPII